jgi:hypothetical protein
LRDRLLNALAKPGLFAPSLGWRPEQFVGLDTQGFRELCQNHHRGVSNASLNPTKVCLMDLGAVRAFLLRQTGILPQALDV